MISFLKSKKFNKRRLSSKTTRGFTLVELIIVSAIFAVMSSILMVRFSFFNNKILTTNLAYDIALSIRQAQTFGINVQGFDPGSGAVFTTGYGVHFDISSNNSYIFFADLDNNKEYSSDELVEVYSLGGGHFIKRLCGTVSSTVERCTDDSSPLLDDLDIVFKRPEPDAVIESHGPPGPPNRLYQAGTITVTSPQGVDREVRVFSTGQISIVTNPS